MDENPQSYLNFATEQNKTPVWPVPYFSIFKTIRAQLYLVLAFQID